MNLGKLCVVVSLTMVVAASVGCGDGGGALVPVEGKVTLNGKPLPGATVGFSPTKATGPGPFLDKTDAEGKFALGPAQNEGDGAEVGEYILVITTVEPDPSGMEDAPTEKEIVPSAFRDGSTRVDVPEGGKTDFSFDMKSR